jgi:hypothetical protein
MISRARCADRGIGRHPGGTSTVLVRRRTTAQSAHAKALIALIFAGRRPNVATFRSVFASATKSTRARVNGAKP